MEPTYTEVKTFLVNMPCDEKDCTGTMESVDLAIQTSDPPGYPHQCSVCDKMKYFKGQRFPCITTTPVNGKKNHFLGQKIPKPYPHF